MKNETAAITIIRNGEPLESIPAAAVFFALPEEAVAEAVAETEQKDRIHPIAREAVEMLAHSATFAGKAGQTEALLCTSGSYRGWLILSGLGAAPIRHESLREAGCRAARSALDRSCTDMTVVVPTEWATTPEALPQAVYSLVEGILLGNYRMKSYQRDREETLLLREVKLWFSGSAAWAAAPWVTIEEAVNTARIFAQATCYARDLTNVPGNRMLPDSLAQEAVRLAWEHEALECEVLNERDAAAAGMGGLLAVGQGSANPPRMIVLRYQGRPQWDNVWGLVGKGITFDTGGISLKKAEGMEEMISDMGGAAVLLGVMQALAEAKPPINVVAVIPAAENMPSGSAFRPGDVVTVLGGRTVEVLNTDAEGRVVLADGMTYARQLGASRLIDVATLTGATLICLGDVATSAVTNDEAFYGELKRAADVSGEKVWQLPAYPEYREMIKSEVADIKNATSPRWAAVITAGLFVGTFAEDTPWIHLDTGGTAWLWNARGVDPKGGTGAMVRTLLHLLCRPYSA